MSDPTVEEVREALDSIERNFANSAGAAALDVMVLMKVTRLWVDAGQPDIEAAEDAFKIEWFGTPKDFASKLMDSQPDPEVERAVAAAVAVAFGDNTLIRRADR